VNKPLSWYPKHGNGKAIAANQTGRNARFDDPLEHVAKWISLAEALDPQPMLDVRPHLRF
jgi:hypothetical protein